MNDHHFNSTILRGINKTLLERTSRRSLQQAQCLFALASTLTRRFEACYLFFSYIHFCLRLYLFVVRTRQTCVFTMKYRNDNYIANYRETEAYKLFASNKNLHDEIVCVFLIVRPQIVHEHVFWPSFFMFWSYIKKSSGIQLLFGHVDTQKPLDHVKNIQEQISNKWEQKKTEPSLKISGYELTLHLIEIKFSHGKKIWRTFGFHL